MRKRDKYVTPGPGSYNVENDNHTISAHSIKMKKGVAFTSRGKSIFDRS